MPRGLSRFDIDDLEIIDAIELKSDGTTVIMTGVTVVSTTYSTKRVVVNGVYLVNEPDQRIEPTDKVTLTGTSGGGAADGNYTVAEVVDDTTFVVVESIADSTGGTAEFFHPSGALRVGFDHTGLTHTTAHEVQDAIKDLDSAITGGGITENGHKVLRQLIHFLPDGPGDGFATSPYKETLPSGDIFPTSVIWWTSSAKLIKLVEKTISYNVNKSIASIIWKIYDGTGTLLIQATDTISYTGIFETSRTRTFA
jgi:hypothetical protein